MDNIKFKITQPQYYENNELKSYDVKVILNEQVLPHTIFSGGDVLAASRYNFASFDLFTCSCGYAGCAGFQTEIVQNKNEKTVTWNFPDDNSYKVGKLQYVFDRVDFEKTFEDLIQSLLALEKQNQYLISCIRDNEEYLGVDEEMSNRYELKESLSESIERYSHHYSLEENFDNFLKDNFKELYNESFYFKYDNKNNPHSFDFKYLISRMVNGFPYVHEDDQIYYENVLQAGNAIKTAISNGNHEDFIEVIEEVYNSDEYGETMTEAQALWTAFDSELYTLVAQENLDLQKLKLIMK